MPNVTQVAYNMATKVGSKRCNKTTSAQKNCLCLVNTKQRQFVCCITLIQGTCLYAKFLVFGELWARKTAPTWVK